MRRNPNMKLLNDYLTAISVKEIRPRFFYTRCCRCGMEYKREPMYRLSYYPFAFFTEHERTVHGCSHCFGSQDDFVNHAKEKQYIMTDEDRDFVERYLGTPKHMRSEEDIRCYMRCQLTY